MRYEMPRAGEVRVCRSCGARNKAREPHCAACQAPLGTVPGVMRTEAWLPRPTALPRRMRFLLAAGLVAAIATGVYVRNIFRASLDVPLDVRADDSVVPRAEPEDPAEAVPELDLAWTPPARGNDAPIVVPPALVEGSAPLPPGESSAVGESGLSSFTPSETRRRVVGNKQAFTNDDLDALRASEPLPPGAGEEPSAPPSSLPSSLPSSPTSSLPSSPPSSPPSPQPQH